MRFEYIHLKNFRQYRDEKIEFQSWTPDKNITVIQGAMGAGKTNIMNAITWCFFGNEKHLTSRSSKGLGMCNTVAANSLQKGDDCEVQVELALIDNDENRIYISRSQRYEKDNRGNVTQVPYIIQDEKIESLIRVNRIVDDETILETNPRAFINRLIPEEIAPYFFFDGDKLNEYFEERSSSMANAVETISQIDLLELVIRHLKVTEQDMVRKIRDPSDEVKEFSKEREHFEKKVLANIKTIDELKKEQKDMESEIKTIDKFLGESATGVIKEKSIRRERLERDIITMKSKMKDLEYDKNAVCTDWGPIALTYSALVQTVALVEEAEHAGKLPAAYKKNFLERMLKDGRCICGCNLEDASEHCKNIEKLLMESDDLSDLSENLAHLSGQLRATTERFPQSYKRLVNLRKQMNQLSGEIDEIKGDLSELERDLLEIDVEEVGKKERERQSLRGQSLTLERRIAILEGDVDTWNKSITEYKNKISRALSRDKKFKDDLKRRELCEDAIESAQKIKDNVILEIKQEIEKLTKKYFLETHWKKGVYSDVSIGEDYSVSVKDNTGQEALGSLSRGETQVLAYAFVISLNTVSGFEFPLVIDTPLGRISSEPRISLGKALSSSLKGRQLIFLMTDVEYTSEIKKALHHAVASEYLIDFDVKPDMIGGEARVVKVIE